MVFEKEKLIYSSLIETVKSVKDIYKEVRPKIMLAQKTFFHQKEICNPEYVRKCENLLDVVLFRYEECYFTLELLHGIRAAKLFGASTPSPNDTPDNIDDFMHQVLLNQYFLSASSLLEYYRKYIFYFCTQKDAGRGGLENFFKNFNKSENETAKKAFSYLTTRVYTYPEKGSFLWGDILRDYRNETAHNSIIRVEHIQSLSKSMRSPVEPSLNGQPLSLYLQYTFDNEIFELFKDMTLILYNLTWVSGPFRPGIYD